MINQRTLQDIRRKDSRKADVDRLREEISRGWFDIGRRYNLVWLLDYARDRDWEKSRLMRAVETIALEIRMRDRPKKPKPKPDVVTVKEAAELLGRHPNTINNWLRRGLLHKIKIGGSVFISRSEIEALLLAR